MAANYIWRVRWRYKNAAGNLTEEMFADFIINGVFGAGDGTLRPDVNNLINVRIPGDFPTPAGSTIVLGGISSAQSAVAYG